MGYHTCSQKILLRLPTTQRKFVTSNHTAWNCHGLPMRCVRGVSCSDSSSRQPQVVLEVVTRTASQCLQGAETVPNAASAEYNDAMPPFSACIPDQKTDWTPILLVYRAKSGAQNDLWLLDSAEFEISICSPKSC